MELSASVSCDCVALKSAGGCGSYLPTVGAGGGEDAACCQWLDVRVEGSTAGGMDAEGDMDANEKMDEAAVEPVGATGSAGGTGEDETDVA